MHLTYYMMSEYKFDACITSVTLYAKPLAATLSLINGSSNFITESVDPFGPPNISLILTFDQVHSQYT